MSVLKYLPHPAIALAIQLAIYIAFENWWLGVVVVTIAYLYRETTQAEYRWIDRYGIGLRANMPWWGGFDPKVWNEPKPWLDWVLPMAVTSAVAVAVSRA